MIVNIFLFFNLFFMKLNSIKTGLSLGLFTGSMHLLWILLILFGAAQPLLDFVYKMHFLNNPFTVQTLTFGLALTLIVITSAVGALAGWFFAVLWNYFHE